MESRNCHRFVGFVEVTDVGSLGGGGGRGGWNSVMGTSVSRRGLPTPRSKVCHLGRIRCRFRSVNSSPWPESPIS
jgi:hypothetical protein